jgi:hypothetical protein
MWHRPKIGACRDFIIKPEGKKHLKDLDVDGKNTLKRILSKQYGRGFGVD